MIVAGAFQYPRSPSATAQVLRESHEKILLSARLVWGLLPSASIRSGLRMQLYINHTRWPSNAIQQVGLSYFSGHFVLGNGWKS